MLQDNTHATRQASPPFNKNDPVDDTRISGYDPIIAPQMIEFELPMTEVSKQTVVRGRRHARNILNGEDDRLLVVVGPCSIHDVDAAIEYAKRLTTLAETHKDTLCFIMRTYFEKPRTTVGWKGLINDPFIDNTYKINHGLRVARQLLNDITNLGLPVGFELLDTISPQYFSDVVSWGAIGARTTECQLHRELSSGVSFPVGFKNGTDGNVNIALDAIQAASHEHHFLGVTKQGITAIVHTTGNDTCHVILRGSNKGPNYEQPYVTDIVKQLTSRKERPRVMVDASHGNSNKNHKNQSLVIADVARQISEGSTDIFGVMVESNIHEGNQKVPATGAKDLKYGVSITDACVDWETTVQMMDVLSKAVQTRRSKAVPAV
ncbi:3-deoxy-7-phosphoheptulonate synthase [Chytriomyces hyalinus]|nr:3-deoxy-7-phosphoheptulonate synthase [Chytriomyces hyalinus]KAJ3249835.1 3-deoxy-7-phosphoheptulonate synthase [Chytriomyces hyalinus]